MELMATSAAGEFEDGLRRLEEIVAKLERENVSLDESVALFREGKGLAQKCEQLLKGAQSSIEAAARGDAPGAVATPAATSATVTRVPRLATSLFGSEPDDADPDL
jgi:exodeoxyribonuclease VII small subunit